MVIGVGLRLQGYGLAWSPFKEGHLLSGSDDAQICLWDVNAHQGKVLTAHHIYRSHAGVVEVRLADRRSWHASYHEHVIVTQTADMKALQGCPGSAGFGRSAAAAS